MYKFHIDAKSPFENHTFQKLMWSLFVYKSAEVEHWQSRNLVFARVEIFDNTVWILCLTASESLMFLCMSNLRIEHWTCYMFTSAAIQKSVVNHPPYALDNFAI